MVQHSSNPNKPSGFLACSEIYPGSMLLYMGDGSFEYETEAYSCLTYTNKGIYYYGGLDYGDVSQYRSRIDEVAWEAYKNCSIEIANTSGGGKWDLRYMFSANSIKLTNVWGCEPFDTGKINLGSSSSKWKDIYATNGTIQTSDRDEKNSIEVLPSEYNDLFDDLKPVRYKLNAGTSDRYHTGFIAQDILESLNKVNLTSQDFAGVCISKTTDDEGVEHESCGLRYDELIALCVDQIQKLKKEIEELKKEKEI